MDHNRSRSTDTGYPTYFPEDYEQFKKATGSLVISHDLMHYSIEMPFVILLETCHETDRSCSISQFTQRSYHSSRLDEQMLDVSRIRPQHTHSCIEIMYVLSGSVTNHVENQVFTYDQGQCCIMNKNIRHCEEFSGDFQAVFLMLRDDFIADLLAESHEMDSDGTIEKNGNLILQLFSDSLNQSLKFDKVYLDCFPVISSDGISEKLSPLLNLIIQELISPAPGSLFFIKGAFSRLIWLMADETLFSISRIHSEAGSQDYLFAKLSHIMAVSHGRCTREELSAQLHYNGDYLNRIMKKYAGKTLLEY